MKLFPTFDELITILGNHRVWLEIDGANECSELEVLWFIKFIGGWEAAGILILGGTHLSVELWGQFQVVALRIVHEDENFGFASHFLGLFIFCDFVDVEVFRETGQQVAGP